MLRTGVHSVAVLASLAIMASPSPAQYIFSPTAGVVTNGGPGFGPIASTWNHSGLSTNFTSGVTLFDPYIAGNPLHTQNFFSSGTGYFEWFSNPGVSSASVIYDMGAVQTFDRIAIWNEEGGGIGRLNLSYSLDNQIFYSLATALAPTNNPQGSDYRADIFGFGATSFRWVRLDMDQCPQPGGVYSGCSLGEVAFRSGTAEIVPEPATITLLATGVIGLVSTRRSKKQRTQ